jgi:hypothetical protein
MAPITNWPGFQHSGISGSFPVMFIGIQAPDGDAGYWKESPVGSIYGYKNLTSNYLVWYEKRKNDGADDDWGPQGGVQCISETVLYSDFTDGGSTSGTYVLAQAIPEGAYFYKTLVQNVTGFTGNSSAALIVGDGTDTDRYMTGTPSVYTTDTSLDVGVASGTLYHDAAKSVTLTVTSGTDFTAVTAGQLTIKLFYFL